MLPQASDQQGPLVIQGILAKVLPMKQEQKRYEKIGRLRMKKNSPSV